MSSPIRERWAEPVRPYDIEDRGHLLQIGGARYEFPVFLLEEADTERMRLGYVCLRCLEPHEKPYPERCKNEGCNFPMRSLQDVLFEKLYIGEVKVGPQTSDEDELAMATDELRRRRYVAGSQILLPGRDFL